MYYNLTINVLILYNLFGIKIILRYKENIMAAKSEKKLDVDELKTTLKKMAEDLEKNPEALEGIDLKIDKKSAKIIQKSGGVAYYPKAE
jgi:hypothetical protein